MPFTFVHPAAVLPMRRVPGLPLAGLVIGAMSPDFEYFLRLKLYAEHTHTLPGLLYACVPLGLIVLVAWQSIVRDPLVAALPRPLRERLAGVASSGLPRTLRGWGLAALAVLIGAATHLLWDSFTHPGYPPAQWLGLDTPSPVGPLWTGVLQRLSDLAGALVLAVAIWRLPRTSVTPSGNPRFWAVTATVAVLLLVARQWLQPGWATLSTVIATCIAGVLLGLFVAALSGRDGAARATPPRD